jgi:FixJ family two-component response regulator/tRNA A-37 threonylcarbamoyl transferase component Bud32
MESTIKEIPGDKKESKKMNRKKSSQSPPILIVDDDNDFLKAIEFTLLRNNITNVECCADSRNVMDLLEKNEYSLLLLDFLMPSPYISGNELLPQIVERYPEIPVIMITAYNDINTALDCMKNGAFDYLLKPFENIQLVKIVRRTLDITKGGKTNFRLQESFLSGIQKKPEAFREIITDIRELQDTREMQDFYILKIAEILLHMGKTNLVIENIERLLEDEQVNEYNIDLFYVLGEAYEKVENLEDAVRLYRRVANFDSHYPGIQKKLEDVRDKIKRYIQLGNMERYKKINKVGEGAMGIVHRAWDLHLDRIVAIKILKKEAITDDSDEERFISEGRKAAQLQHPNIVTVYDVDHMHNDCFISMEFILGKNLSALIKKSHPIAIENILIIARKLFEALDHSHQKFVIHRDIKPQNIMITYENEVKVVDFGIAVLRDELRNQNIILGTPLYMSPEQIKSSTIDHLTDIYSAGVTLFHLVTGIVPFAGSSHLEIKEKHLKEPVPSIKEYRNDIPEKLVQIIEKCMEKKKEDRYQSADQVLTEIAGIRDSSGKAFITDKSMIDIFDAVLATNIVLDADTQTPLIFRRK